MSLSTPACWCSAKRHPDARGRVIRPGCAPRRARRGPWPLAQRLAARGTVIAHSRSVRERSDAPITIDDARQRRRECVNGSPDARTVVVVGNGMVGHRFCDSLATRDSSGRYRIVCFGDEPRTAYDRVHMSGLFAGSTPESLALADADWYAARGIALHVGERVTAIDRVKRTITSQRGRTLRYDVLVLATGSAPFVPPLPGIDLDGVFTYRTIDDVERIRAWGGRSHRVAVIGGGLLGLEAAKAAVDLGLETYVVEFAPRLMPRQVDAVGGEILQQAVESMGVRVLVGARTTAIVGDGTVAGLALEGSDLLDVDMVIVSAGIRARDELARQAGLQVGPRGGILVDDELRTSDTAVYCIGARALHR